MYLQRKAGVTICGRYDIVALFALVGRCVALQDALSGCQTMCGKSVREVAATHGNISFKDVLLFHREE